MKPLAIDLFCGLGGWSEALLAEGWDVTGYDIEAHQYGEQKYPGKLVIQDVLTIHGSQFKDAHLIVASPPCQEYSYMAMPWSRAKAIEAEYKSGKRDVKKLTALFDACFRIQREASEAAGRYIPIIVENVRGAQKWVGKARWNFGSYYLWGDVPALMPITQRIPKMGPSPGNRFDERPPNLAAHRERSRGIKNEGGGSWDKSRPSHTTDHSWKAESLYAESLCQMCGKWCEKHQWVSTDYNGGKELWCYCPDCDIETFHPPKEEDIRSIRGTSGFKSSGMNWSDQTKRGQDFTRLAAQHCGLKLKDQEGYERNYPAAFGWKKPRTSSKSNARKAASAMIAKIPFPLARWIAKTMKPANCAEKPSDV